MSLDQALSNGEALARELAIGINDISLDAGLRSRVSAACQSAAMDHHAGIVLLFRHQLPAPALALLRCLYECYIRGTWLFHCATDEQISDYAAGNDIPRISDLIGQMETSGISVGNIVSEAHRQNWQTQTGLTHGGIQLAIQHLSSEAVEANCAEDEVIEALSYANAVAGLAAMQVAVIANDLEACERVLEIGRTHIADCSVQ
jgi:hypothetical protein